jgi:hypothetical protein
VVSSLGKSVENHKQFTKKADGLLRHHFLSFAGPLAMAAMALVNCACSTAQVNVTTYQNDIGRTGQNLSETILNTSNVNATQFGKLFSQPVDGQIYAQPLYLSGITVNGATHNVIFVATENDSVYAFDADSNGGTNSSPLWQASLLSTAYGAASGATTVSSNLVGSDIQPQVGITGTPVIDPVSGTLYVVSKTMEGGNAVQRLHALNVSTGLEKFGGPVVVTATVAGTGIGSVNGTLTFDPLWENQRPGLLLLNGIVYIGFAAHGDNGPWHGWILGYNATTLVQTGAYCASPNGTGGGFWMSGQGLAADQLNPTTAPYGRMFVPTGNGDYTATSPYTNSMDYGDSHLDLNLANGAPTITDEFTTNQQATLDSEDGDVGSGGMMVVPTQTTGSYPHLAVQAGKAGTLYLLNRDNLGGYNATADQVVQELPYSVGDVGVWSSPAYWNGNVYYWGRFDNLKQFSLVNGLLNTTPTESSEQYGFPGATPSISANGTTQGIVWTIDSEAYVTPGPSILQAHNASSVATTLYSSATNTARDAAGDAVKFTVPTVVNGKVYVGAAAEVDIYGLLSASTQVSAPTITPGSESFQGSLTVTLADTTANASIYYTTNGTAATTASTLYSGPITVSSTETINAIATATGLLTSAQNSATYSDTLQAAAVVFSLPTGTYSTAQSVILSDTTANAAIYYTTNGTTPTASSTLYTGAITVNATETISAIAIAPGVSNSPVISETYTIDLGATGINFTSGFAASSGTVILNGSAQLNDSRLQLTDGLTAQAGTAWYETPVNIQTFTNDFTFQLSNPVANGMTFTIQNSSSGALGGNGSALGFAPIANSVAIKFDFYTPVGSGTDSTGLYVNGATPTTPAIDLSSSGINLLSDDDMAVHMVYNGTTLTMTITDMVTSATWTNSWTINIPSTIGSNTAYVGFTGATGAYTASQKILTWSFVSSATSSAAATPTFSPVTGTYTSAQTVTISDGTSGTTIYYTTNGATPTTSSSVYSSPLTVSSTETLNAIAAISGSSTIANSAVGTATYTITTPAATPTFSVAAGTYTSAQTVTISDTTTGATIYYTTNGTAPSTSSTVYSGAITVSATETVEAIAVATGYSNSAIASAVYAITLHAATPTFSVAAGTYTSAQTVTISDTTTGTTIYYTTNGTAPTTSSSVYSGAITVSATETLEAIAIATGYSTSAVATAAYTISTTAQTAAPTFSVPAGVYYSAQTVTISDATPGAIIYYTFSAAAPTTSSAVYRTPVGIGNTFTLQAIAVAKGYTASNVTSAKYTLTVATPIITPTAGSYAGPLAVTISTASPLAGITYTTNGTTPNLYSTKYIGPFTVSANSKVEAIGLETGYTSSPVATASYTITAAPATPTFSPTAGTYSSAQTVAIGDTTSGATIYYTTNGTTPTTSSSVYSGPIAVSATETLNAIAVATGSSGASTTSTVGTAAYTITTPAATPTFSVAAGTYTSTQSVTISDATSGATIYYTTNGTTPTTSSTVYSGAITVSATETVEAIAIATGHSTSAIASAAYTISSVAPTVNFSSGFTSTGLNLVGASIVSGALELTDGGAGEQRAAWFTTPVNVQSFTTTFEFQLTSATADGFTFAIQNSAPGVWAIGGNGENLGYGGIGSSVAVKFDLYSNAGEGSDSTGFYTDGAVPTVPAVDMTSSGVNLHSGDLMQAVVAYNGTTLTLTITDTVTNASFTTSTAINIPTTVGSDTAYIGFTGGTGGLTAIQKILNWTYTVN